MPTPPVPSQKDGLQVLKYAFEDDLGRLRVDAIISPDGHDLEINHVDDSIAIGTSTELFTATDVAAKVGLDTSVIVSVLPTGASTSALQTTGNTSLASIDAKLTAPLSVTGPLTNAQLRASAVPISAAALPLPAGASTSALQTSGNTTLTTISSQQVTGNNSLASIDSKTPALGQTTMSASVPVTIASDQSPTVTIQLFTLPFDSITATYPTSTQEIYQSRVGGIAGTVQQTLTINYTDATKSFITDVART